MQDPAEIQLLLLPGLGGDHRMLRHQRDLPFQLITPDYIAWSQGESLQAYAARFAEAVMPSIARERPLYIGGISLGGAIAIEIADALEARGVILIGSLRSSSELRPLVRLFGRYIAPWLPLWVYRAAVRLIPVVMMRVSGVSRDEIELAVQMYSGLPKGLFRAGYEAICRWEGSSSRVKELRIHSTDDHIIPIERCSEVDIILDGARHLVAITRAREVNQAITEFIGKDMER